MSLEIKVPSVGESITEVMIVKWLKSEGDAVATDDPVAEIETDKATLEIPSPGDGRMGEILKQETEWASVGEVVALIEPGEGGAKKSTEKKRAASDKSESKETSKSDGEKSSKEDSDESESKEASKSDGEKSSKEDSGKSESKETSKSDGEKSSKEVVVMPAAQRLLAEKRLSPSDVEGTGKGGRILKEDVLRTLESASESKPSRPSSPESAADNGDHRQREKVSMSPLRRTVAKRLVEAQSNAALLTTFNEADMSSVIELRNRYGEAFQKKYEVKLGFMSFFVKAAVEALKKFPAVNAQIEGDDIVYHNYFDVGVAVSGAKGLVVPVLRNAEALGFAEIEKKVADFGARGKENKIELSELEGGTFTISNGGIFGSLLSTPIVNPPQSGVLGLHAINDRPVAVDGAVVVRPMMYLALTYDHRIVDGREAVTFLRTLKDLIEDPSRILLEV